MTKRFGALVLALLLIAPALPSAAQDAAYCLESRAAIGAVHRGARLYSAPGPRGVRMLSTPTNRDRSRSLVSVRT